ncbi:hypothetical protein [Brachybacterium sp. Marseille-Q7125]|uniref:hypothetical protein n=1 Tax=Brachybacterium sp. Marseille-Q7125 TaxID=2932815 RepID=UPI001FF5F442|nr:hypothetical protein [Brachybacterium sp. Marseille-Q7125]
MTRRPTPASAPKRAGIATNRRTRRTRSAWRAGDTDRLHARSTLLLLGGCLGILALALFTAASSPVALLVIWAALGWYRHGRIGPPLVEFPPEEISAQLRERLRLIGLEHAAVLGTLVLTGVITMLRGIEMTHPAGLLGLSADPGEPPWRVLLLSVLFTGANLVLTALTVGGDCTVRRPAGSMALLSILATALWGIALAAVLLLPVLLIDEPVAGTVPILLAAAAFTITLALLPAWARSWTRETRTERDLELELQRALKHP